MGQLVASDGTMSSSIRGATLPTTYPEKIRLSTPVIWKECNLRSTTHDGDIPGSISSTWSRRVYVVADFVELESSLRSELALTKWCEFKRALP